MYSRFDFVQVPLFHPLFKRDSAPLATRPGPATRSDLVLSGNDWSVLIVGKLSPWIQLESSDAAVRRNSEDVRGGEGGEGGGEGERRGEAGRQAGCTLRVMRDAQCTHYACK